MTGIQPGDMGKFLDDRPESEPARVICHICKRPRMRKGYIAEPGGYPMVAYVCRKCDLDGRFWEELPRGTSS